MICQHIALWINFYGSPTYFLFFAISCSGISISLTTLIIAFAKIAYKMTGISFPKQTFQIVFIASVGLLSLPFWSLMFPISFVTNPQLFNTVLACAVLFVPLQLIVTVPILFIASNNLSKHINDTLKDTANLVSSNSQTKQKFKNLLSRIHLFRMAMIMVIPCEVFFALLITFVYFFTRAPLFSCCIQVCINVSIFSCNSIFAYTTFEKRKKNVLILATSSTEPSIITNNNNKRKVSEKIINEGD